LVRHGSAGLTENCDVFAAAAINRYSKCVAETGKNRPAMAGTQQMARPPR
jgi:hypothetical protein